MSRLRMNTEINLLTGMVRNGEKRFTARLDPSDAAVVFADDGQRAGGAPSRRERQCSGLLAAEHAAAEVGHRALRVAQLVLPLLTAAHARSGRQTVIKAMAAGAPLAEYNKI